MLKKLEAENIGFNMVHIHAFLLLWITIYKLPTSKSLCKETKITSFRSINLVTLRQKNIYYLGCGWVSVKLSQNISGFWPEKNAFSPRQEKYRIIWYIHTDLSYCDLRFILTFSLYLLFLNSASKNERRGRGRKTKTKRKAKRKTKRKTKNEKWKWK